MGVLRMKYGVYTKYRYFVTYFTQPRAAFHAASAFCTRTKKSPSNQNLPYMMLKTRFPFLYASTSLDTKTLTIALNFNFESYMTIRCLAPQHVLRFFHFWWLLCLPPQRSTERSRWEKKTPLQWFTFTGKSWSIVIESRRSHCSIGLRF